MNTITRHYITALYFTDTGDDDDQPKCYDPLSTEARAQCERDCARFTELAGAYIAERGEEHAGHDFWLTRNGHGCGFWDGDWPEPAATFLTALSKQFGEVWTYLGDDGLIHLSGGKLP